MDTASSPFFGAPLRSRRPASLQPQSCLTVDQIREGEATQWPRFAVDVRAASHLAAVGDASWQRHIVCSDLDRVGRGLISDMA